jgi:hypothetical protein
MDICAEAMPESYDVSDASGHREVSCYLHDGRRDAPAEFAAVTPPAPHPRVGSVTATGSGS